MNVLSICVATLGLIVLVVEFVAFEEMSDEYTWSNVSIDFNNNWIKLSYIHERFMNYVNMLT